MARYVDADKMLRFLAEHNAEKDLMVSRYNADWIISFIETQPIADVVPRCEFEEIINKLECLLCHATGGRLSKHTYDFRVMTTAVTDYINEAYEEGSEDGALNVFDELEFEIAQLDFDSAETRAIAIEGIIAALKKEYTERSDYIGGKAHVCKDNSDL